MEKTGYILLLVLSEQSSAEASICTNSLYTKSQTADGYVLQITIAIESLKQEKQI